MKSAGILKSTLLVVLSAVGGTQIAHAASAVLNMTIGGTCTAIPNWNVDGADVASGNLVTYLFNLVGSGTTLTSATHTLKLVNPTASTNIALVLPTGCSVGGSAVSGVTYTIDSTAAYTANGAVTLTNYNQLTATGGISTYMTLLGVANHTGAVACTTSGSLTYTY